MINKTKIRNKALTATLNKCYNKKNAQIKQTLHIQSKKLANMNYNTIVIGDLTVKKLMSTDGVNAKKKNVRKSFNKSNITMFLQFLKYKCQATGTDVIKIDEHNTTQLNCLTGKLFKDKVELQDRTVKLNENVFIDRDLNSAINILKRWEQQHIASVNRPLAISADVLAEISKQERCTI